jgi:protein TonB
MPSRLTFALALSLTLHGSLFLTYALEHPAVPARPRALQALLQPTPKTEAQLAEPVLKNTLAVEAPKQLSQSLPPAPVQSKTAQVSTAQTKLAQHLYYPPEAVHRGLEGEVRLLIVLSDDGSIVDVNIAAGSGYPLLDDAAIKAAYAMGKLSGMRSSELILPVIFRLQ